VCEPQCPAKAIRPDTEPNLESWLALNAEYAPLWPNITAKKDPPGDADEWLDRPEKLDQFIASPPAEAAA
jgi:ferredoxin